MRKSMDSNKIRMAIEQAVSVTVQGVQLPGIADAELKTMVLTLEQVQLLAVQLERKGGAQMRVSVELELFLRVSNTEVLSSIEDTEFLVNLEADGSDIGALATHKEDWAAVWERGMESIKRAALLGMRRDVLKMDETLAEDSYTFQAAMVLLASELVGPYVSRIMTFVGYPLGLVQPIAVRLQDAIIWEGNEVRCEDWFDPERGATAFMLDVMVAEGELIRNWSEEQGEYVYQVSDIRSISRFAV